MALKVAPPPPVEVAARLVFGLTGNSAPCQLEGWSIPEPGYTWSIGTQSRVRIPYRSGNGTLMLELTVSPMTAEPIFREQRLIVTANGVPLGDETIGAEGTLGFVVPPAAMDGSGCLTVTLTHPNPLVPKTLGISLDDRPLAVSVREILLLWTPPEPPFEPRRRPPLPMAAVGGADAAIRFCTALAPADLMHCFESLGHNCEFGLMQRAAGAEPLGLLRFGGISMPNLLRGLDHAFEGIGDPARLHAYTENRRPGEEFLVRDTQYSVTFHTQLHQGNVTAKEVVAKFASHLTYLRRMFHDVLDSGSRIFVLQHPSIQSQAQVLPVLNVLRSYGRNVLLYVTEGRASPDGVMAQLVPVGTVEQERIDLFHGYTDQFAPVYAADRLNLGAWLSICANTYRMWREQGGGGE